MCTWTQRVDVLHVYVDVDGGRGCVDARMHCVCMQMQMSIKKGHKRNTYLRIWVMGAWTHWHADADDCREKKNNRKKKRKIYLVDVV